MREFSCRAGQARWAALLLVALLAACDPERMAELEAGVATEADLRARSGELAAVYAEPDGARTFDYPRQPSRTQRYAIKQEAVWDRRFADGQESKVFSTTFNLNGKVLSSATTLDGPDTGQLGR
jgi:hypothetical protein